MSIPSQNYQELPSKSIVSQKGLANYNNWEYSVFPQKRKKKEIYKERNKEKSRIFIKYLVMLRRCCIFAENFL